MNDKIDHLRQLAYCGVYMLPGAGENPELSDPAALEALNPAQRDKVHQIALRRLAFQILFEMDARGIIDERFVHESLATVEGLGPLAAGNASQRVLGAWRARNQADSAFAVLAPEWPTHRLASVDRAILRMAHYELSANITPAAVCISEAVELTKHFSTERSPAFVNALLDRVAKNMQAATAEPPTPQSQAENSAPGAAGGTEETSA
jgi:N utilization substance protein B